MPTTRTEKPKKTEKMLPDIAVHEDSLEGLVFVFTGDMKHFTRETAKEFVTIRGGLFRTGITKKTNYVVTGVDPSDKKMETLKDRDDVQVIDEDGFIDLVRQKTNKSGNASDLDVEEDAEEGVEETADMSNKRKKSDSAKSRKKQREEQENLEEQEELDIEGAALVGGSD